MNGWVTYLDSSRGPVRPVSVEGVVSLIEQDGKVREVVVEESDGSATFIKASAVVAYGEA